MPTIIEDGQPKYISVDEFNQRQAEFRKEVLGIDETTCKLRHIKVNDLDKIWINGQEFSGIGYQGLLTVNTKTYVEEPSRANDGSMPNINDHDTFIVPRCKVNFKYFNIYDYQRLCDAVMSNEFTVKYWDKQFNKFVVHKMYCEPEEMKKLYNVGFDVFGVLDYEISFIGTLNNMETYTLTYDGNGGGIVGNPQEYSSTAEYHKGSRVYIVDGTKDNKEIRRYFESTWYENTFTPKKTGEETILLTNTTYWKERNLYIYSATTTFDKGDVAYEIIYDNSTPAKEKGRNYYIAIGNSFFNRPLSDTQYWERIIVTKYSETKTYSSNKTSDTDEAYGQFVIENNTADKVYEAIYYFDTIVGKDPTNTQYWKQIPIDKGIKVRWGDSVKIENPIDLFTAPEGKSANSWTTISNGTGYTYYAGQSLNVFDNMTLYAKWVGNTTQNDQT